MAGGLPNCPGCEQYGPGGCPGCNPPEPPQDDPLEPALELRAFAPVGYHAGRCTCLGRPAVIGHGSPERFELEGWLHDHECAITQDLLAEAQNEAAHDAQQAIGEPGLYEASSR